MVATLLRLKLTLLRRSVRSPMAIVGLLLVALYAGGATLAATAGLVVLRGQDAHVAAGVAVPGLALFSLLWLVTPVLFTGVDETLSPGRFALLPVPARRLMPGIVASSFVGIPGVMLVVLSLAYVVTWSRQALPAAAALVAAVLGALTCVLLSRSLTTALSSRLSTRRSKERMAGIVAVFSALLGIGMQAGFAGAARLFADRGDATAVVGTVASWTPFGWAWAVPADVAQGAYAVAAGHLVLAVALAAGLWRWWERSLEVALTSPLDGIGGAVRVRDRGGRRGLERLFGTSPRGAIATRVLTMFLRDGRSKAQLVSTLMMPVIIMVPSLTSGAGGARDMVMIAAPFVAWSAGFSSIAGLATDGTGIAWHMLAGVSGRDDRWGRSLAFLLICGVETAVVLLICAVIAARADLTVCAAGVSCALLGVSLGASALVSGRVQWAAPQPGASPFQQNAGAGGAVFAAMVLHGLITLVGALPAVVLAVLAVTDHAWAAWLVVPVGAASGVGLLFAGCALGGRALDRRWPEALQAVRAAA